jgi:hypothetical protein
MLGWADMTIVFIFLFLLGTFPTCEMCNAGYKMLRETKKYNVMQRKIIWSLLEAHLKQQQRERIHMDMVKMRCAEVGSSHLNGS